MYCADIVAIPSYDWGNSTYILSFIKNGGNQVTEKPFASKWKKGDVGTAKRFSKST